MFLLVFSGLRVLVLEDEVNLTELAKIARCLQDSSYLIGATALVGTKHDHIGRSVGKLLEVELLVFLKKLQVGATTNQGVWAIR